MRFLRTVPYLFLFAVLLFAPLFLLARPAGADYHMELSTGAVQALNKMIHVGLIGPPQSAVDPGVCSTSSAGAFYYDTGTGSVKVCYGAGGWAALPVVGKYAWTNAQIVALGAALTGDITMVTLPAKTEVKNAYVVITGQGAGTTTFTVACGTVGAGYIDLVVASNGKAAANTVYGDASGERGTNAVGYFLPSYTATTDVKCHYVTTVENLDQVTGSAGYLALETQPIP